MKLSENINYLAYGVHLGKGDFSEAKQSLVKIISTDSLDNDTLSLLYYLIAKLELELGNIDLAEKCLNDIVKIYPADDFWESEIDKLRQIINEVNSI